MTRHLLNTLSLSLLLSTLAWAQPAETAILNRVYSTYRTAQTYQDVGTVTSKHTRNRNAKRERTLLQTFIDKYLPIDDAYYTTTIQFQTAYVRATDQFRFHYQKSTVGRSECLTIAHQQTKTLRWHSVLPKPEGIAESTLSDALASATGISLTASRKIPGLLLLQPIDAGWDMQTALDWKRLPDARQDGTDCYRLTTTRAKGKDATLYIDKKTFLIRRIDETWTDSEGTTQQSLVYKPTLNSPVPAPKLAMTDACRGL
ncbi:hypothetical protein [Rudanella lutea]|uniref:hypothetical protein n=1 Tax=Rudanella lutea TaxID=451374 RepID=UPI00036DF191|nr:hypothetical protein [Rudanella lutea]